MKFKEGDIIYSPEGFIAKIIENDEDGMDNFYTFIMLTGSSKGVKYYNLIKQSDEYFKRVDNRMYRILYGG